MTHKHHIIPKHMNGDDDPNNLITMTVTEHAEVHRLLYEQHGRWQDYVAWKGLLGILSHEECVEHAIKCGGLSGAITRNHGLRYTDGNSVKKFMPGEEPDGWVLNPCRPNRRDGIGFGTKGRHWYYNPKIFGERGSYSSDEIVPDGWLLGQGKKNKISCYWYTNGDTEGQFEIGKGPENWRRGRKNKIGMRDDWSSVPRKNGKWSKFEP